MAVVASGALWEAGLHMILHTFVLGLGLVVRGWPWLAFLSRLPTFPHMRWLAHKGVGVGCEGLAMAGVPLQVTNIPSHNDRVCLSTEHS